MELNEDLIWWCVYSQVHGKDPIKIRCCCGHFFNHLCDGFHPDIDHFPHRGTIEEAFGVWPFAWPAQVPLTAAFTYCLLQDWSSHFDQNSQENSPPLPPLSLQVRFPNQPATEQSEKNSKSEEQPFLQSIWFCHSQSQPRKYFKRKKNENKIQTWFSKPL